MEEWKIMDAYTILLHFNILLQQNISQFSQNPPIHQKRQNDVLRDNMIWTFLVIMLSAVQQISQQVFDTPVKKW